MIGIKAKASKAYIDEPDPKSPDEVALVAALIMLSAMKMLNEKGRKFAEWVLKHEQI